MPVSQSLPRRGILFIISSPSGAGKSTISRMLLAADDHIDMSVSATTRPMRPGEVDGKDYFFISEEQFKDWADKGEFFEWATVFGNRYGTPKTPVKRALEAGHDVLFDIDWQGAQQLHQKMRDDIVRVFILPPSIAELEHRLRTRATDSDAVITDRMARAVSEIDHWGSYDYVLVNHDVESCFREVQTILKAERMKRSRQTGLIEFVQQLTAGG
jgi:guanylate kinase